MVDPSTALRILIIDDNEELRSMLGEILERVGYTVQSTEKAKDAHARVEALAKKER